MEWMRNHPKDFLKAILINTSFGGISPLFHRLKPSALIWLLKVPALKGRAKESRILALVSNHKEVFDHTLDHWDSICKVRPVSTPNTLRQLMAGACFNVGNFMPPIPVYLIGSTEDRMVSIECSRSIAKKWKLPLVEHSTGGHDLTVDDPKWVAEKVSSFIS